MPLCLDEIDDEVLGVESVNESAITCESPPVIRETGGDHSGMKGGTKVPSDRIVIEVTAEPGQSFLDRMIALVEVASCRKRRTSSPRRAFRRLFTASLFDRLMSGSTGLDILIVDV